MTEALTFDGPEALAAFGEALARHLRPGDWLALSGSLGAGKTTLARGLLRGLGWLGEVPSPTFTLVQPYEPPEVTLPLWHVDLYRLEHADEADALGLFETDAAIVLEWPERLGDRLPPETLRLGLDGAGEPTRRLTWTVPAAWESRWPLLLQTFPPNRRR